MSNEKVETRKTGLELLELLYTAAENHVEMFNNKEAKGIRINLGQDNEIPTKFFGASEGRTIAGWPINVDCAEGNKVFTVKFEEQVVICDKELESKNAMYKSKPSYLGTLSVDEENGKDILFYVTYNEGSKGPYLRLVIKAGKPQTTNNNMIGGYSF